jgi:hypothetical protein
MSRKKAGTFHHGAKFVGNARLWRWEKTNPPRPEAEPFRPITRSDPTSERFSMQEADVSDILILRFLVSGAYR